MQSRNGYFLIAVAILAALSIWGVMTANWNLGLDVKGGVRLIYQVKQTQASIDSGNTLEQDVNAAIRVMTRRAASSIGVVEANVAKKGEDQIIVELPGTTDLETAKDVMGSTGRLIGYYAANVYSGTDARRYTTAESIDVNGIQEVQFSRLNSDKTFGSDDEEFEKMIKDWEVIIEGSDLARATPQTQPNGSIVPSFVFSSEGAKKMREWTQKYRSARNRPNLAFAVDGRVISVAPIKENTVLSDQAFIDGDFEAEAVQQLCQLLNDGALDVELQDLASETVDPSIGAEALDKIIFAGGVSFGVICLFLIVYYSLPGFIAMLAMLLYGLFTIAALLGINATFSLASIAALILSVGMAVDANVLVFERIKEELRNGRQLASAVPLGFKRALSAIVDSNACTIITAFVLFLYGTGPVKGFATTLIIGVAISFFTAFTVTRSFLIGAQKLGIGNDPKHYALKRNWFGERAEEGAAEKPIEILGRTKTWFALSAVLIGVGMVFVGMGGIKPNVEFGGGWEGVYHAPSDATKNSIDNTLADNGYPEANVKLGSGRDSDTGEVVRLAYVTVPPSAELGEGADANQKIAEAAGLSTEKSSFKEVGPTIQKETVQNAVKGVVLASVLIVLYLAIRFGVALGGFVNGMKFGLSAVAALLHDVAFVVGFSGIVGYLLGWEISALFITAMLTVIGFSVHDSIVIFDRIRENLRRPVKGESFEHLVNKSITQSVARSINTSVTAFVPLMILVAIGTPTPELKFMCLTMAAGIAVGTYSSIFNASPVLYLWNKFTMKRKGEQAGLVAEAAKEAKLRARIKMEASGATAQSETESQYGTIKRRSSAVDQATQEIDEDDD